MPPSQPDIRAAHPRLSRGSARARLRARLAAQRRIVIGALAAIGAVTAALILTAALARRAPSWWRSAATDPASGPDLAERVERAVASRLHKWEDSTDPWTIAITQEQANAWLTARAPRWAANRAAPGAPPLPDIRVRFQPGAITAGLRPHGSPYIFTARISPTITPEGALAAHADAISAGSLPVGAAPIARLISSLSENLPRADDATATLGPRGALLANPRLTLDDGRLITLRSVSVEQGRLILTCTTDRPSPDSHVTNR